MAEVVDEFTLGVAFEPVGFEAAAIVVARSNQQSSSDNKERKKELHRGVSAVVSVVGWRQWKVEMVRTRQTTRHSVLDFWSVFSIPWLSQIMFLATIPSHRLRIGKIMQVSS